MKSCPEILILVAFNVPGVIGHASGVASRIITTIGTRTSSTTNMRIKSFIGLGITGLEHPTMNRRNPTMNRRNPTMNRRNQTMNRRNQTSLRLGLLHSLG